MSAALAGFGGANCQMAAFALSELLPNKWRHIGVVLADTATFISVIVAPVTARIGWQTGTWRWNFYAAAIAQFLSFVGLYLLYYPPAHPYNIPFKQIIREIDYMGKILSPNLSTGQQIVNQYVRRTPVCGRCFAYTDGHSLDHSLPIPRRPRHRSSLHRLLLPDRVRTLGDLWQAKASAYSVLCLHFVSWTRPYSTLHRPCRGEHVLLLQ